MDARKKEILYWIISSHIETKEPIGSKFLVGLFNRSISAATIRNEMSELEHLGYITHPHTSAGRIPTDKGYRFYVDELINLKKVSHQKTVAIKKELELKIDDINELIEKTTKIVANLTQEFCIALFARPRVFLLKEINIIKLNDTYVLTIWITKSGFVIKKIVDLRQNIEQSYLNRISNFLNAELEGLSVDDLETIILIKLKSERNSLYQLYDLAQHIVNASVLNQKKENHIFLKGREHILSNSEFQDINKTKRFFAFLDQETDLADALECDESSNSKVIVKIGKENKIADFWDYSLISTRCKFKNIDIGSINILGARSINYANAISMLGYVSDVVDSSLDELNFI